MTTDFMGSTDYASSVAIQADGKIVVAGYSGADFPRDFALARYNTDGSLDTNFGGTGKVTTDFGSDDSASSVAIQADGKIVAAGSSANTSNYDFALVRYNSDGSLDTSFGGTGKVTTDFTASYDFASSIAIEADGKIVAAGWTGVPPRTDFALAHYNSDGSLDTSFGGTGKITTNFSVQTAKLAPSPSRLMARSSRPATAITGRIMISPLSATAAPLAAAQRRPQHQRRRRHQRQLRR